jgi:hypothetical protein
LQSAVFDRILELGMLASHRRAPMSPSISLLALDPPEQVDKVGWKGTIQHMRGRGAKDVADCDQDDILDVFGLVR